MASWSFTAWIDTSSYIPNDLLVVHTYYLTFPKTLLFQGWGSILSLQVIPCHQLQLLFFNDDVKPLSWTIPPGMDGTEKVPDSTLGCSFFWGTTCGIFQLHKVHCRGCAWVNVVVSLCFRRRCFGWFLQFLRDHCPSIRCHSFQDEKGLKRPIWCPFCSLVGWLV